MAEYVADKNTLFKGRTKYPFDYEYKTSFCTGYLIPVYAQSNVAPGSTFSLDFEQFTRALPMIRPPMGDLEMHVAAYFVPHRIVWNDFKQFYGENDTSAWTGSYDIEVPKAAWYLRISSGTFDNVLGHGQIPYAVFDPAYDAAYGSGGDIEVSEYVHLVQHSLGVYLGYPQVQQFSYSGEIESTVNALKGRAFLSVYNEFYRDQNLQSPVLFSKETTDVFEDFYLESALLWLPPLINKVHDVFTGVLPNPQKGGAVSIPLGDTAPIIWQNTTGTAGLDFYRLSSSGEKTSVSSLAGNVTSGVVGTVSGTTGVTVKLDNSANLFADLANATGANVTDFRTAVLLQHYYEYLARHGSKYYEVASIWGVRPSNAREDLPELINSGSIPINIQAVTSTAASGDQALGFQAAKSETYRKMDHFITYTTKEHGTLLVLAAIRQSKHTYSNRMAREDFFDFDLWSQVNPLFAGSSDVPVYKNEVSFGSFSGASVDFDGVSSGTFNKDNASVLGYQEYGYQEKFPVSIATGLLNPSVYGSLSAFTMADSYQLAPTLNGKFVAENPLFVARAFSKPFVDSEDEVVLEDHWISSFRITGSVTRAIPSNVLPGLTRI